MRDRIAECERQRKAIAAELIADLGRKPTAVQRRLAGELAGQLVEAERLRLKGLPNTEQVKLVARLSELLLSDTAAASPSPRLLDSHLAALGATGASQAARATMPAGASNAQPAAARSTGAIPEPRS
jgi:hypothetical protein